MSLAFALIARVLSFFIRQQRIFSLSLRKQRYVREGVMGKGGLIIFCVSCEIRNTKRHNTLSIRKLKNLGIFFSIYLIQCGARGGIDDLYCMLNTGCEGKAWFMDGGTVILFYSTCIPDGWFHLKTEAQSLGFSRTDKLDGEVIRKRREESDVLMG